MSEICDIEPFLYSATPVPDGDEGASSNQINEQSLESYLARLVIALCADITALEARIAVLEAP